MRFFTIQFSHVRRSRHIYKIAKFVWIFNKFIIINTLSLSFHIVIYALRTSLWQHSAEMETYIDFHQSEYVTHGSLLMYLLATASKCTLLKTSRFVSMVATPPFLRLIPPMWRPRISIRYAQNYTVHQYLRSICVRFCHLGTSQY